MPHQNDSFDQQIHFIAELFSNTRLRRDFLASIVAKVQEWTACECVGIRVIDPQGRIPYEAYMGFSQEFWEHENWLSLKEHQCGCIRLATGKPDPLDEEILTEKGSLWTNDLQEFGRALPEECTYLYRGKCIDSGFASLAVVPICNKDKILGLVHLADTRQDMLPLEKIQILESITPAIGEVIARFSAEDLLRKQKNDVEKFVYNVAHDLKSPLITIQTYLDYLRKDIYTHNDSEIEKDVGFLNAAVEKISSLIEGLLKFSRINRFQAKSTDVLFRDLVEGSLKVLAGRLAEKNIEIVISDEQIPLHGDPLLLGQVWQNLIENSIKYMGDQPQPKIEIGIERYGREVFFYVRDNGVGIDPCDSERIFGLFEQLDSRVSGHGMGLALVKKIVEFYHGNISLVSEGHDKGSCFRFTLPDAFPTER